MAGEPINLINRAAFGLADERPVPPIPRRKPELPDAFKDQAPGFDPFQALGFLTGGGGAIPSLTGGDAAPSRATAGDIFARTGAFNVGSGSASDGTSPTDSALPLGNNNLVFLVAIGAVAWVIAAALRR